MLWKDTFAPSHGEFAHSLQWFAAGHALELGARTAALYKKAGQVFSNSDAVATRGDNGQLERARQPLWAWLVDCFRPGELESQIGDGDVMHVFSRKCRVPNQINQHALDRKKWFIHLYIDHRRQWLDKLAVTGKEMRKTAGQTVELESNMLGIMAYQGKAYKAKTDWNPDDAAISSPSGKSIERSGMVYKKTGGNNTTKTQVEKTYHGVPGTVSLREISAKSLIS